MSSYLTSSSSLGRTGSLESKLCCQSPVRDAELGYSLFLPSHQHTQPVVRGQRRVDNLVCRDQPSEHRQDRRKPRKGMASPGNKLMWKPVRLCMRGSLPKSPAPGPWGRVLTEDPQGWRWCPGWCWGGGTSRATQQPGAPSGLGPRLLPALGHRPMSPRLLLALRSPGCHSVPTSHPSQPLSSYFSLESLLQKFILKEIDFQAA